MHLLGEGIVLSLFRAGEASSPSPVEEQIFRLCMQDEARHVAYGTMHLRYRLEGTRPWPRTSTPTSTRARRSSP